ncbi:hypothetical protein CNYM01_14230 [Colletotrichum nymphaeae SA-01]|uniref:Uncharacterized protein n=1 Tax=Colletotrichum nymphaeae SA-01 TaxID=1460502 RepID=A0A135UI76_9PEZI|nr:hypothetical protein CNYM01_14230 [Colletotrichum nymphaeae SA-01]
MNRAPIIVPIWESATPISLERSPITVSIWQSTPVSSHKPYQHSQINAEHITDITGKLCQAVRSPIVADVDYYVGLWEELHDCYWSYMRSHNTEKSAQRWPEFVEGKFGNRTDAILEMIYRGHVTAVESSSEWKLLIRFDRVRDWLGLSGPAMFLQPGPEVAISSKALKIILKLLNYLNAPTFSGAEILAEIYNVIMQRNTTSEKPTYLGLRDVQEAQGIL